MNLRLRESQPESCRIANEIADDEIAIAGESKNREG